MSSADELPPLPACLDRKLFSRTGWAAKISAAWRSALDDIIETGALLIEAKAALPHGEFEAMIEAELPFGKRTAQMLMKVAADSRLTNAKHASLLPPSWYTLYELSKLPDDVFAAKLADGTIHPEMQRKDLTGTDHGDSLPDLARNTIATKWTGNPESFTPSIYIEAARAVMDGIDLDPASNAHANETVKAREFFD